MMNLFFFLDIVLNINLTKLAKVLTNFNKKVNIVTKQVTVIIANIINWLLLTKSFKRDKYLSDESVK